MKAKLQNRRVKLRAFLGAVAILLGALSGPVTLTARADDVACGMTCCVNDGYCCCNPVASAEEQSPDKSEKLSNAEFVKSCPEGCTPSQSSFKIRVHGYVRAAAHHLSPTDVIIKQYQPYFLESKSRYRSSSPRDPPSHLLSA